MDPGGGGGGGEMVHEHNINHWALHHKCEGQSGSGWQNKRVKSIYSFISLIFKNMKKNIYIITLHCKPTFPGRHFHS